MQSMENMLRLGALTGNSASHCGADDRWEIAEARSPVRDWSELRGGDEMPEPGAGSREGRQIWKRVSKYLLSTFPTTSDPSVSTQSLPPRSSPGSCVIISKRICPHQPCSKAFRWFPIVLEIKASFPSTICKALQGLILIPSPPDSLCTCCSSTSALPPPPPPPLVNTDAFGSQLK